MTWSARYLTPAERVVAITRRHVFLIIKPCVFILLGLLLVAFLPSRLTAVVALATWCYGGWLVLSWYHDRLVVTTHRIFAVTGILNRKVATMPIARVTDMTYFRSFIGRVFGYGTISVESAGQDQALTRIDFLPHPDSLYRTLTILVNGGDGADLPSALEVDDDSVSQPAPVADEPALADNDDTDPFLGLPF